MADADLGRSLLLKRASPRTKATRSVAAAATTVAFSPDGTRLATTGVGGQSKVRIWDPATGRQLAELSHGDKVVAAAFSPDGTRLATGSFGDAIVRIWDPATGQQLAKLSHGRLSYNGLAARLWRGPRVQAVAFSPDGTRLATGSDDHTARIWAL